jgi:hypothetical protein
MRKHALRTGALAFFAFFRSGICPCEWMQPVPLILTAAARLDSRDLRALVWGNLGAAERIRQRRPRGSASKDELLRDEANHECGKRPQNPSGHKLAANGPRPFFSLRRSLQIEMGPIGALRGHLESQFGFRVIFKRDQSFPEDSA